MRLKLIKRFIKLQNFISSFNLEYETEFKFYNFTLKYYVNVDNLIVNHYMVLALKGNNKIYTFQILPPPKIATLINSRYFAALRISKDFLLSDECLRKFFEQLFDKFEFRKYLEDLINQN